MIIEPYKPEHLDALLLQPAQEFMRPYFSDPQYRRALAVPGKAFAASHDGVVLGCAGVMPIWEGRAEAWALLGADLKNHFLAIHHATKRFLQACDVRRVEATVDAEFCPAREWIVHLGFRYEGPLRAYTPDGRDCLRFVRIR